MIYYHINDINMHSYNYCIIIASQEISDFSITRLKLFLLFIIYLNIHALHLYTHIHMDI